jgi:cytochrome c peroxidase
VTIKLDARQTQQAELGRRLFLDKRLSHDNTLSCAACHALENYGVDRLPVSVGIQGKQGAVNAPTVYNSGYNFRQFWDGRALTLEEQVGGPLENPVEMASNWPEALGKIGQDAALQDLSRAAYGRKLDEAAVRDAIAGFERTLITPNAPFDRFLRGDKTALSPEAEKGWQLFRGLGCSSCHQGINLGGNMYATLGVMEDYFAGRTETKADQGLFNRTKREEDRHKFKVPSLRNVAMTGPYFHDGATATLEAAVDTMARTQLGLQLSDADRGRLVAFLKSLTGQLPKDSLTERAEARP